MAQKFFGSEPSSAPSKKKKFEEVSTLGCTPLSPLSGCHPLLLSHTAWFRFYTSFASNPLNKFPQPPTSSSSSLETVLPLNSALPSSSLPSFHFRQHRSFLDMSRSLTLITLLALTSTSVFANEIVEADQSPAPFQLNLARTFSSTIDQLKKRNGFKATAPKVSRAKERSISDDLVLLLKRTPPSHLPLNKTRSS